MFLHGLRIYKIKIYIWKEIWSTAVFLGSRKAEVFQRIVTKYQILYFCISVLVSDLSCWSSKTGMKINMKRTSTKKNINKRTSSWQMTMNHAPITRPWCFQQILVCGESIILKKCFKKKFVVVFEEETKGQFVAKRFLNSLKESWVSAGLINIFGPHKVSVRSGPQ